MKPAPKLAAMLAAIPLPKWVFTNADCTHAEECLKRMGIRDLFQASLIVPLQLGNLDRAERGACFGDGGVCGHA